VAAFWSRRFSAACAANIFAANGVIQSHRCLISTTEARKRPTRSSMDCWSSHGNRREQFTGLRSYFPAGDCRGQSR
jgi:hypothetical protein